MSGAVSPVSHIPSCCAQEQLGVFSKQHGRGQIKLRAECLVLYLLYRYSFRLSLFRYLRLVKIVISLGAITHVRRLRKSF